ncbi:hypothetical protein SPI_04093 [Niveomyces insectorum RCEF 264]|uniref:Uncharacterized protein n=1 Tax=Niveomyces insectorum RCEF 264 TaxID=1081102 RepID=A0A167VFC2_9HYPO|nr:hypothetical protein SPI_04093 [Niveomyces insectorum RCEF 264]
MRSAVRLAAGLVAAALTGPAAAKPEQIRSDQDPVFHYYLQTYPKNASLVVLGPVATSEYFTIGGTVQSTNTSRYLNIGTADASYKPLTFDAAAATTAWQLEGDTLITATSSSFGRQLNFLVCKLDGTYWQVFLQTGSATPSGQTCSNYQSLHLPCLC